MLDLEISEDDILEFKNHTHELLNRVEKQLSELEVHPDFSACYDEIHRAFHSIKSGANLLGFTILQAHIYRLEEQLQQLRGVKKLSREVAKYFVQGIEAAKGMLDGDVIKFDYKMPENTGVKASQELNFNWDEFKKREKNIPFRIFIIDDDMVITISEILKDAGFEIFGFSDLKSAVENLENKRPEAILTDFKMPQSTGIDVLNAVREFDHEIPVIALSGYLTKENILNAFSLGLFAAIEKPFAPENLIATCKNAADKYRLVKLLNMTISLLSYQFPEVDDFLRSEGKYVTREMIQGQFKTLLETRRQLKTLQKKQSK